MKLSYKTTCLFIKPMNDTPTYLNKKNKKICLIINNLGDGGVERVMLSLAHVLSEYNHEVDVIVLGDITHSFKFSNSIKKFNIHTIKGPTSPIEGSSPFSRYVRSTKNIEPLRNKIIELGVDFDLIVSNTFWTDKTCKKLNLPNVYYCIHASLSSSTTFQSNKAVIFLSFIRSFLVKRLYKNQNLITVSRGVEQDLIRFGIRPKTVRTIYNPFNFNTIRQQAEVHLVDEKNYIIHVGRFCPAQKRHDILIKAYKKSGIKQKLLLIGDNDNETGRQIKKMVTDLSLQNQVIFKGFISNPFPYIKNAKAFILSSDYEGLPTVLIEALILKTPVVSTDCKSGPSEILIDELKPFLSPIGDVDTLAINIKNMVDNPVKITNKYTDKFSAEKSAEKYLSLCS